ncbi:MAG: tryptophan synthase subunit alpha [Alistipes putredinis]|nr:MAG: tryptophan synthase subunit alpha [Alistipes putredinis]
MNRINTLFASGKQKILSVYFCAGYPTADSTCEIIERLAASGVDMIEIGIPFSDPMADGEVIQRASTAALRGGMSLAKLFSQLEDIRRTVSVPLILMGYLNPIMQFGFDRFCRKCSETGIDGYIIPDLPFDRYLSDYKPFADKYDLRTIMLITPETEPERVRLIDSQTDGFIYMVSSAATTGVQKEFDEAKTEYFRRIEAMNLRNPRLVGFGISNRATFEAACKYSRGAIVGSKFIELLGSCPSVSAAVESLHEALNA